MPTMTINQARQVRERIQQAVQRHARAAFRPNQVERMQWLVAGTLDKWLGKDLRHALIDFLFEDTQGGSTKHLNGAQLRAMLDWMALGHDDLNGYYATTASEVAGDEMRSVALVMQPVLLELADPPGDTVVELFDEPV